MYYRQNTIFVRQRKCPSSGTGKEGEQVGLAPTVPEIVSNNTAGPGVRTVLLLSVSYREVLLNDC